MSLVGIEFASLGVLNLGEITDNHAQVIAIPGESPLKITTKDLKQWVLLGIADNTLHISTNQFSGSLNPGVWRNPSTGAASSNPGWNTTDIFPIDDSSGADFAVAGYGSIIQVLCYNGSTFISSPALTTVSGGKTFTIPSGTDQIALNISNTGETSFPNLRVNAGSVVLPYEAPSYYFLKIKDSALVDYYNKSEIDATTQAIEDSLLDVESRLVTIEFQTAKNLLNPYKTRDGVWILTSTSEGTVPSGKASTFIPVVPGTTYTISGLLRASDTKRVGYYNASKEKTGAATIAASGSGTMAPFTFTAGAGVYFVSIQISLEGESFSAGQMETGSSATTFEAYEQTAISVDGVPTLFASTGGGGGGGSTNLSTSYGASSITISSSTGTDATVNTATISDAGVMSAADKIKLNGLGDTDLSYSRDATTVTIISSTGNDAIIPAASNTEAGCMSAADKVKLEAAAPGSTVATKTANYTLTSSDNNKIIVFNSASAVNCICPISLPVGFSCLIIQEGVGVVSLINDGTSTVINRETKFKTAGVEAMATIVCRKTNYFTIGGDLTT